MRPWRATTYNRAKGHPEQLSEHWRAKREGFIERHLQQMRESDKWSTGWEPDRTGGTKPTRRHLALAMWAYSPSPTRLARWLDDQER